MTGLNVIITLCAVALLVSAMRVAPESRLNLRLLGLGFLLIGGADVLKPVSEALATAVEAIGMLTIFGLGIRNVLGSTRESPKA